MWSILYLQPSSEEILYDEVFYFPPPRGMIVVDNQPLMSLGWLICNHASCRPAKGGLKSHIKKGFMVDSQPPEPPKMWLGNIRE
jgi:hypothetical protein